MYYDILDAVAKKLGELFPNYIIYMDLAGQGPQIQIPCFFVGLLELTQKQVIGQRYFRNTRISVKCLPGQTEEPGRELSQIADALMDNLDYIDLVEGPLKGSDLVCRMENNTLKFEASYSMHVIKLMEKELFMEALDTDIKMKGS